MSNPLKSGFDVMPPTGPIINNPQMQLVSKLVNSPIGQIMLPVLQGNGINPKQLLTMAKQNPQYLVQLMGKTPKGAELIQKAQNVLAGKSPNEVGDYAMTAAKEQGISEDEFRKVAEQFGIKV